jgi:antitoxin component of RelBE/YafQ-DinJ toxin-antitoxin module
MAQLRWAVRTRLDKNVRLRFPGFVLADLYNIKQQTGLTISDIVRLMVERVLNDEALLNEVFGPYKRFYKRLREKKRMIVDFDGFWEENEKLRV